MHAGQKLAGLAIFSVKWHSGTLWNCQVFKKPVMLSEWYLHGGVGCVG